MALPLEKMIEETFSDLNALSPEKMQALVQETMKTFTALQEKIQSDDPKAREEAVQEALQLKETLSLQAEMISRQVGLSADQLADFANSPENEENDDLNAMKTEINAFRQQFVTEPKPAIKKSKKKSNKIKLVG
ncbi:MAG: hypothetical protein A3E80_06395 [Chlamydiae bacterium RIFCSPHIGHO2_12_FULL_49_9]|nr:MAG: hypothetical protein A3E80_06395 [Chlamydiae bacterium RIFCSPHIGHO2_12_FULL_49_9]